MPTQEEYEGVLAEMFALSELLRELDSLPAAKRALAVGAAIGAHLRILERYAALGPSLPN